MFGTGATELVHIGQAVMGLGGTIDYLVDAVFNYPTLTEAYKVAALDATQQAPHARPPHRLIRRVQGHGTGRHRPPSRPRSAAWD